MKNFSSRLLHFSIIVTSHSSLIFMYTQLSLIGLSPHIGRGVRAKCALVLGDFGPIPTLKISSRGEIFSRTYKPTTCPFPN